MHVMAVSPSHDQLYLNEWILGTRVLKEVEYTNWIGYPQNAKYMGNYSRFLGDVTLGHFMMFCLWLVVFVGSWAPRSHIMNKWT